MDLNIALGFNIKKARKKLKMSQVELAKLMDVDKSYISNLENSKGNPTLNTLHKLSEILKVPASLLIEIDS